jgi:hypothetical protein
LHLYSSSTLSQEVTWLKELSMQVLTLRQQQLAQQMAIVKKDHIATEQVSQRHRVF